METEKLLGAEPRPITSFHDISRLVAGHQFPSEAVHFPEHSIINI